MVFRVYPTHFLQPSPPKKMKQKYQEPHEHTTHFPVITQKIVTTDKFHL